jgi:hypothetical protein
VYDLGGWLAVEEYIVPDDRFVPQRKGVLPDRAPVDEVEGARGIRAE